jgi:hypothetical protein
MTQLTLNNIEGQSVSILKLVRWGCPHAQLAELRRLPRPFPRFVFFASVQRRTLDNIYIIIILCGAKRLVAIWVHSRFSAASISFSHDTVGDPVS